MDWIACRFFFYPRSEGIILSDPTYFVQFSSDALIFRYILAMATTYRDRTTEFRSLSETLKKIGPIKTVSQAENETSHYVSSRHVSSKSEFNRKAAQISFGMHETSHKIARLAQLAKRSSMFDDPIVEIQELTVFIKNDITALNVALSDLQTIQNMEMADGSYSEDKVVHSTAVCDDLKNRLMGVTKHLQNVLTTRTENIKANESRKQIFSTTATKENASQNHAKTVSQPPPWLVSSNTESSQPPTLPVNGGQVGSQLRRRLAVENTPSQHMEMSMLQQVVPRQENYSESRGLALHNVESTISELSGIFTDLATMVSHQGELAIRIDDNMDESLANVEGARSSLLRHLNRISSNRWLMIKIFGIIIFFLMVFIFFMA